MYRLFILTFIFLLTFSPLMAENYYVDNNASGGNGSINDPFDSIADGLSALSAGDTLFIRGDQNQARVYFESPSFRDDFNGQSGAPIVIMAYPGEQVQVTPEDRISVYSKWLVFQNFTIDMDGLTDDAIRLYGDNNIFRNLTIRNGQRDGIDISNADNNLIENCTIYNFTRNDEYDAHGIILDGGDGNVIRNNTIYDCKGDCIQLYKENVNVNTLIENNLLYTTLGSGSENAIDLKGTQGCIIRGNKMWGFRDAPDSDGVALKVNKDSDNMIIEENEFYDSNGGFRISGDECENIVFRYNTIHNIFLDGDPSKYGYGIQFDGVIDIEVSNNTFVNIPGPLFWIASRGATNITMMNNIFYNTNDFKGDTGDFSGIVEIDYNGWFQSSEIIAGSNDVTGNDPMFVDEAAHNYKLQEGSPAIDAGAPVYGDDYPGGRIDLGAFEYEGVATSLSNAHIGPESFRLEANYPNPFNPATTIEYSITRPAHVTLEIFDIVGKRVTTLVDVRLQPGSYDVRWNAHDTGHGIASGIYYYRLTVDGRSITKQMVLLK